MVALLFLLKNVKCLCGGSVVSFKRAETVKVNVAKLSLDLIHLFLLLVIQGASLKAV